MAQLVAGDVEVLMGVKLLEDTLRCFVLITKRFDTTLYNTHQKHTPTLGSADLPDSARSNTHTRSLPVRG